MNSTVIYAAGRKARSCTYNIAELLIRWFLTVGKNLLSAAFLPLDIHPKVKYNKLEQLYDYNKRVIRAHADI